MPAAKRQAASRRNGTGPGSVIVLNLDQLEHQAAWISASRCAWESNDRRMLSGDKRWDPVAQALNMTFRSVPLDRLREEVLKADFEAVMAHECKHVKDLHDTSSSADLETKAYLAELTLSPLALIRVENHSDSSTEPHRVAAQRIWRGLVDFPDMYQDRTAIYWKLSPEDLAQRARALYESWYGPYQPPDEGCIHTNRSEFIRDWRMGDLARGRGQAGLS